MALRNASASRVLTARDSAFAGGFVTRKMAMSSLRSYSGNSAILSPVRALVPPKPVQRLCFFSSA
jgi:hypothetical protein